MKSIADDGYKEEKASSLRWLWGLYYLPFQQTTNENSSPEINLPRIFHPKAHGIDQYFLTTIKPEIFACMERS